MQVSEPKYHDLPIAMQLGIFIQFTMETNKRYDFIPEITKLEDIPDAIGEWFCQEHSNALQEHVESKNGTY